MVHAITEAWTNCNGSTEERVIDLTWDKASGQAPDGDDIGSGRVEMDGMDPAQFVKHMGEDIE